MKAPGGAAVGGWVDGGMGGGVGLMERRGRGGGCLSGGAGEAASIMRRMVWPQRPQTEPAPQASATCLVERAPASMAFWTVMVVTPRQRQMYISGPAHLEGLHQAPDEQRRVRADPRFAHGPRHGVGGTDPLCGLPI